MPAEFLFGAVDPLAVFLDSGAASVLPPVPTLPGVASLPAMPPVPLPASTLAGIGEGSSGELSPPAMGRGGAATDSSGAMGSGTTSGGSAGMLMGVAPAAATSAPAPRGKGGKKELSEEQKERIKAKNRRWVLGSRARPGWRRLCQGGRGPEGRAEGTRRAVGERRTGKRCAMLANRAAHLSRPPACRLRLPCFCCAGHR